MTRRCNCLEKDSTASCTWGNRSHSRQSRRWSEDISEWPGYISLISLRQQVKADGEVCYVPQTLLLEDGTRWRWWLSRTVTYTHLEYGTTVYTRCINWSAYKSTPLLRRQKTSNIWHPHVSWHWVTGLLGWRLYGTRGGGRASAGVQGCRHATAATCDDAVAASRWVDHDCPRAMAASRCRQWRVSDM